MYPTEKESHRTGAGSGETESAVQVRIVPRIFLCMTPLHACILCMD